MIGNYKGKMFDEVSRLEDDLQPVEDDVQTTYTLRMMTLIYI